MLALLYAAQGIPDAMVLIVFPAYLAAEGVAPAAIGGFLATAMLPNVAKLLTGPLIDRWAWLPMGRRKPWILAGQLGIAASFLFLATLADPVGQLALFTAGAFCITLATAVQDVATDATAMDLMPAAEQGRANGVMWGAKTVGTAAFAAGGAVLLDRAGFAAMTATAAALLIGVFLSLCLVRERPGERLLPWTGGEAAATSHGVSRANSLAIIRALRGEFTRPAMLRLVGLSLMIGLVVGMTGSLAPVLMVQSFDWPQSDYAEFRAGLKLIAGIAGMAVGGWLVDRLGPRVMIAAMLGGIAAINTALAFNLGAAAASAYLVAYEFLLVFAFVSFFAATMRQCSPAIAATQFSFTMVCGNLTMSLGAKLLGPLIGLGGERAVLIGIALAALAGAIVFASAATRAPLSPAPR